MASFPLSLANGGRSIVFDQENHPQRPPTTHSAGKDPSFDDVDLKYETKEGPDDPKFNRYRYITRLYVFERVFDRKTWGKKILLSRTFTHRMFNTHSYTNAMLIEMLTWAGVI